MSLVILTIGVAIVQLSGSGDKHHHVASEDEASRNRMVGLVAVLCAACTSGFAGVYFEKILKGSSTTLWLRFVRQWGKNAWYDNIFYFLLIYSRFAMFL